MKTLLALVPFGSSSCDLPSDHRRFSAILQSQRDCVSQPRVASHELPWVNGPNSLNPEGVASGASDHCSNPFRVRGILQTTRRVARDSQPRAEGWNPVGIPQSNVRKALFLTSILLASATAAQACGGYGLVAHEWGTFTSVQGGDGVPLRWSAPQIGDLPNFVHNWLKPELGRLPKTELFLGKAGLSGLQRMETPVIYFYSDQELVADVEVRFPKGLITEWYPQASRIGPCTLKTNASPAQAKHGTAESLIQWQNVRILPQTSITDAAKRLPFDTNGTHFFAARETDAALLRMQTTSPGEEHEKFLFYRGTGSFNTPLVVTTGEDGLVSLQNNARTPLSHLSLLHVQDGKAEWSHLEKLEAKSRQTWRHFNTVPVDQRKPLAEAQQEIGAVMVQALTEAGLYPAEAKAMVKTWNDAWFAEEGVRVLYLLPRDWTDEILPLKLTPQPRELIRVMVGRAEIIPPQLQRELAVQLKLANEGNVKAKEQLQAYYRKLDRFYGPALQLANDLLKREQNKPLATAAVN